MQDAHQLTRTMSQRADQRGRAPGRPQTDLPWPGRAGSTSSLCAQALRRIGLALAACEKSVQVVYEHNLRPREKLHQPWLERVTGQLHAALQALQDEWEGRVPEH
jgi:hypothetical protein